MKTINIWYESEEVPHFTNKGSVTPESQDVKQITITERQYKRLNRLTEDYWELVQEIKDAEDKQIAKKKGKKK